MRWRPVLAVTAALAAVVAGTAVTASLLTDDPPPPVPGTGERTWTARAAAPWQRTEVAAAAVAGRVWVAGGFAPDGEASADVAAYDPAADAWTAGPALPQALHHTAVAADGERLWVAGGYTARQLAEPTAAVRVLDPASGRWSDGPPLPSPRAAGALAWDGKRLVYGGGVGPDGLAGDVWALERGAWTRLGALSPAREHLAAAADGRGTTWFLGGRTGGIDANLADVDVVTGASVRAAGELPTARGGVAGFHVPGAGACAAGGESPEGTFHDVECVAADGSPTTLPPLPESRHGLGAAVLDGTAYALLGGPSPGLTVSDTVQSLDLP
jgi:hypothetical protein